MARNMAMRQTRQRTAKDPPNSVGRIPARTKNPRKAALPASNRLLSALPVKDRRRFLAGCHVLDLKLGDILCEVGDPVRHVYFPLTGFISMVAPNDKGSGLELGLIGNEGMFGVGLLMGVGVAPSRGLVQGTGASLRMDASLFRRELDLAPQLRRKLNRYAFVLMAQLGQLASCVRFHRLPARLARWLLVTQDRAHSDVFRVTHELLAMMLGVRREGVTEAAVDLQRRKLIRYSRGELTVVDRAGLEAASCECYVNANQTYESILKT
jgi:CRP-like cAMP-binding protein